MASGTLDKVKPEDEDDGSEEGTITSDYFLITGNISSTIRSDSTSFSASYISIRGVEEQLTLRDLSIADTENGSGDIAAKLNELQAEDNLTKGNQTERGEEEKLCSNCSVDRIETCATHFCESCPPNGKYICHKCLQSHNRWAPDHAVVSLSVYEESSWIRTDEKLGEETNTNPDDLAVLKEPMPGSQEAVIGGTLETSDLKERADTLEIKVSQRDKLNFNRIDKSIPNEQEPDRSGTLNHPMIRKLRPSILPKETDQESAQKTNISRLCKDQLYSEIIKDQIYKKPSQTSAENPIKYGSYSVRTSSDTKDCFVTGICQIEGGSIVLADSENCRLKILDPNRFGIIASYPLKSNPSVLCYMKEKKVAIALDSEIVMVDITNGIDIRSSIHHKRMCKGLAYNNGNLYVCTGDLIEVYSEEGDRKTSFRPSCSGFTTGSLSSITISENGDTTYAADREKGIVVTDNNGQSLKTITDNLFEPNGLCFDGSGKLYVTEMNSGRVLKVDPDTESVKQVIREVCQNGHPISMCYENIYSRLILGVWKSDQVHVFSCP